MKTIRSSDIPLRGITDFDVSMVEPLNVVILDHNHFISLGMIGDMQWRELKDRLMKRAINIKCKMVFVKGFESGFYEIKFKPCQKQ